MQIHERVKAIRESKKLSQSYLAHELNLDQSQYSRREKGEIQFVPEEIVKLSKLLKITISELFGEETKALSIQSQNEGKIGGYVKDLQIDTDFELLFSDEYINNISERLNLYNELGAIKNEEELQLFQKKLIDRFGPMPPRAIALMNSIRIKWIATSVGIEKLVMKQGKMIGYFVSDQQSDYYHSARFHKVLQFVQK